MLIIPRRPPTMMRLLGKLSIKAIVVQVCLVIAAFQLAGCSSREQRAENYYDRGMDYLKKKDFVKANLEFRNALQIKGDMVAAWRGVAQVDEHNRNLQALATSLRKIVELDPKDVETKVRLARAFVLGGAVGEALKMATAASEQDPQNKEALAIKAVALFRLKDFDGAVVAAQKVLKIDAGDADANVILASAAFRNGDSAAALQILNNVSASHKEDLGVIFLEISIFDRKGDLQRVESLLRRLIALHPKEAAFRTQLIRFYVAHGRSDDAVKELRAEIAADPADSNIEMALINLLGTAKGVPAARAELVARINAGGKVFPYQIALAKLDYAQNNAPDSIALLKKLIAGPGSPDEIIAAQSVLAEIYMRAKNIAAAEPLVSDILHVDSRNISGLRLRAAIHLERDQFDDAIGDLRRALNDQPRSADLLASLAIAYERSGSIELADKAYLDATKASNFSPTFGLNYVAFLRRRGLSEQAESVLVDLAGRNPKNVAILSALAEVKLARQDWLGAHTVANAIREIGDKSDIADQINGAAFSGEKKFGESLTALQNAYDAKPGAIQPMAALVKVYLQAKQPEKAEAFLNAALKANPANAEAWILLGSVQLSKNDTVDAAKSFETAVQQQPNKDVGYKALADFYTRQNKIDDAIKTIQAGLAKQPKSFALQLTLAGLLENKKEYEPAIAQYESILKEQPGSMIVANNLASLLADHRTDKASLERANSLAAVLAKSDVAQFKDTLGWLDYRRGDYTSAVSLLEEAATKLPNVALVHYHLGMALLGAGDKAKAGDQLKRARDLAPNDAELTTKVDAALKGQSKG